ncbi:hypothetical protein EDD83_00605 [Methanohalophilus euhalobius]|uniref:Uncharacterized protein n=1 Tax=Methanohalophilus euhalobius TaxID=51203 RepID=A0A3M9LHQ9_9EURY|nr:hypothetical protein EDD83_00605 [Methanohalophilus euhalobius]
MKWRKQPGSIIEHKKNCKYKNCNCGQIIDCNLAI